jgi:hypothetical protein
MHVLADSHKTGLSPAARLASAACVAKLMS